MVIRIRGSRSRGELYWNRLADNLLTLNQEQILEQWGQDEAADAVELRDAILAANNGYGALILTEAAAQVLAGKAYYWLDYYQDAGHDYNSSAKAEARNRAGLCQRILAELKSQGVVYVEARAAVVWS
tara:strand:+ start:3507 stop:3890 length:384 start_codon:yes stop_codon:yes gene_type:complete